MSLNMIVLQGRLTRPPEKRYTQTQKAVTSFTLAVDRDMDNTDFINCVAWDRTAEFVADHVDKGSLVVVQGRLQMRDWTDKDGNKRTAAEVVADRVYFGESKKKDDSPFPPGVVGRVDKSKFQELPEDDGDLPF